MNLNIGWVWAWSWYEDQHHQRNFTIDRIIVYYSCSLVVPFFVHASIRVFSQKSRPAGPAPRCLLQRATWPDTSPGFELPKQDWATGPRPAQNTPIYSPLICYIAIKNCPFNPSYKWFHDLPIKRVTLNVVTLVDQRLPHFNLKNGDVIHNGITWHSAAPIFTQTCHVKPKWCGSHNSDKQMWYPLVI
jgi:hypothetical protein